MLLAIFLFFLSYQTLRRYDVNVYHQFYVYSNVPAASITEAEVMAWKTIVGILDGHAPNVKPPERLGSAELVGFTDQIESRRPRLLSMPDQDVEAMRKAHEGFVKNASSHYSLLAYRAGSDGIVTTAGGKYLPVVVISIRMLRRTGSNLPVEVFLTSGEEYEKHACDVVLPALNARCVVLENVWRTARPKLEISKFQLKIFAILLSSFENLLFMDADCFPVQDPWELLHSEPFTSKGLVSWPDFWASTTSDQYYKIASRNPPSTTVRATSEAGEFLLSKKTHSQALALAAYYNYYGPDYFYPLLSQGGLGEGDKETFLAAALALDAPFYAVTAPVRAIGNLNKEFQFAGSAMVQYDPRDDFRLTSSGEAISQDRTTPIRTRPFFVHANFPKWNPETMFAEFNNPTIGPDGQRTRAWVETGGVGEHVERGLWEEMQWTACEHEWKFESWKDHGGNCELVTRFRKELFGETSTNATREREQH